MAHSYVFELAFLNVLAPTFGKLLLTFFWVDKSIWIVCLLTLTFWLVQLQLSSILNKEAIIIIIIIIITIIIIIMEDFIVKVSSWIKYNPEGLPA